MANKPISDNTAFPFETNVRAIAGLAGFKTGTTNSNTKIGGTELVQSVINGGTASAGGLAVYSTSGTGKELSTYISLNYTNGTTSTPSVLALGTPSNPSTVQISGNFNGPNAFVSPKLTFLTKNTTSGSNTVSIEPSSVATANQSLVLPPAAGTAGQGLKAASVSSGDVLLEWYTVTDDDTTYTFDSTQSTAGSDADPFLTLTGTDTSIDNVKLVGGTSIGISRNTAGDQVTIAYTGSDDNTTYDLGTASQASFGQIDLIPSSGATDSIKLTGAGTVSVTSNATGDITITGAGSSGGDSVQTLTGLTWDYNNGNSAIFTPNDNGTNPIDVLVASNFPSGARGALKVIPTNTTKFALFAGSKIPSSQNVLTISATNPTILYYFYDGTNFYWFYDINYIDPIYPSPASPEPTVDGNYNLLGFWFPGSYAGTDGAGVGFGATWTKSAGGNLIGDLDRVGATSTTSPAMRWYDRDNANEEAPYWALSEGGTTNQGNWESGTLSTTIGTWSATFYMRVLSTTATGYEGILDPNKNDNEALYLYNRRLFLYDPSNYVQGNFPAFTPAGTTTSNQQNPNTFSLEDEWIFCHVSFLHNGGSSVVTSYIGCKPTFDASTDQGGSGTILGRDGNPITLTSDGLYVSNVSGFTLNDGNWTSVEYGSAGNGSFSWSGGHLGLLAMYAQEIPASVVQANWANTREAYYIET
tara:strand:- start:4416 stop:6509 length:2094 start_codon:yes stop_codon:yes gene_type:complete